MRYTEDWNPTGRCNTNETLVPHVLDLVHMKYDPEEARSLGARS